MLRCIGDLGIWAWCQPTLRWFHGGWPPNWSTANITAKELLPIVVAAAFWGPQWRGKAIHFCCDNMAIVHAGQSGKSTEPLVMQLLQGLHLFAMEHHLHFTISHIAGTDNSPADLLSRNKVPLFLSQVPRLHQCLKHCPKTCCSFSWHRHPRTGSQKVGDGS